MVRGRNPIAVGIHNRAKALVGRQGGPAEDIPVVKQILLQEHDVTLVSNVRWGYVLVSPKEAAEANAWMAKHKHETKQPSDYTLRTEDIYEQHGDNLQDCQFDPLVGRGSSPHAGIVDSPEDVDSFAPADKLSYEVSGAPVADADAGVSADKAEDEVGDGDEESEEQDKKLYEEDKTDHLGPGNRKSEALSVFRDFGIENISTNKHEPLGISFGKLEHATLEGKPRRITPKTWWTLRPDLVKQLLETMASSKHWPPGIIEKAGFVLVYYYQEHYEDSHLATCFHHLFKSTNAVKCFRRRVVEAGFKLFGEDKDSLFLGHYRGRKETWRSWRESVSPLIRLPAMRQRWCIGDTQVDEQKAKRIKDRQTELEGNKSV